MLLVHSQGTLAEHSCKLRPGLPQGPAACAEAAHSLLNAAPNMQHWPSGRATGVMRRPPSLRSRGRGRLSCAAGERYCPGGRRDSPAAPSRASALAPRRLRQVLGDEGLKADPAIDNKHGADARRPIRAREMIVCFAGRPARVGRGFPALPSRTLALARSLSRSRARSAAARSLHIYLAPFSPVITASQRAHLDDGLHLHRDAERKRVGAWFGQGLGLA